MNAITLEEYRKMEATLTRPLTDASQTIQYHAPISGRWHKDPVPPSNQPKARYKRYQRKAK